LDCVEVILLYCVDSWHWHRHIQFIKKMHFIDGSTYPGVQVHTT